MEIEHIEPPREFSVGDVTLRHSANVRLEADEQVTFTTPAGGEYDVARKSWGFYATPSLNRRLPEHGLRPALAANSEGRAWVLLVERGREEDFLGYLAAEGMRVVAWLDRDETLADALARLEQS